MWTSRPLLHMSAVPVPVALARSCRSPKKVHIGGARWGRHKRYKTGHPSEQSAEGGLSLESIRSALWREPERPDEHFSQQLTTVRNMLSEQLAPASHVPEHLPLDR